MNELDQHTLDQKSFSFLDLIGQTKLDSWTPTDDSGAGLTFSSAQGRFFILGPVIIVFGFVVYPITADVSQATIGNLPKTCANVEVARQGSVSAVSSGSYSILVQNNTNHATLSDMPTGAAVTNANMSGKSIYFQLIYF